MLAVVSGYWILGNLEFAHGNSREHEHPTTSGPSRPEVAQLSPNQWWWSAVHHHVRTVEDPSVDEARRG